MGSAESALLGLTGCSNSDGFLVSSVRAGSPGALAAIKAGDVVTAIGDRPVHSAQDIDAAIGSGSTVRVSYMIKGSWLAVHEVKLR
jgi:putative serine protease PepD